MDSYTFENSKRRSWRRFQSTMLRLYAILACLVIGGSATHSDGEMENISTAAECQTVGGTCIHRDNCDLSSNVFHEGCGETLDGCCISKETVCESKNGNFTTEAECATKSGFRITGLHLDGKGCCAPFENGQGNGNGNGNGQGKGNGNGAGATRLSYGMDIVFALVCSYRVVF